MMNKLRESKVISAIIILFVSLVLIMCWIKGIKEITYVSLIVVNIFAVIKESRKEGKKSSDFKWRIVCIVCCTFMAIVEFFNL